VRLDRNAGIVPAGQSVFENVAHAAVAFTGPVVIGIILSRVPGGVLDVDVDRVIANVLPKLPWILFGPRLGFGAIGIEDRVGSVKNPFQARTFVEQLKGMLP